MFRLLSSCALALSVIAPLPVVNAAQSGFGEDGQVLSLLPGFPSLAAKDVAVDSLGRVVISGLVGDFAISSLSGDELFLLRYLPDGTIDPTFAGGSGAITSFGGSAMGSSGGLVVLPAGSIVQLGYGPNILPGELSFAVARVASSGTPDVFFDGDGKAIVTFPDDSQAGPVADLARLDDGRYVIAGSSHGTLADPEAGIAMVLPSGSLDPSFGSGGFVAADFVDFDDEDWSGVAIDAAAGIVVAGATQSPRVAVVARYHTDGSVDAGFGTNGAVMVPFEELSEFNAVAVDGEGRIVAGGCPLSPGFEAEGFGLARLTAEGTLDAAFGTGGTVVTTLASDGVPEPNGCITDLKIDAKGRIVVAGWAVDPDTVGQQIMVAARYRDNGSLDPGFGAGGIVQIRFPNQTNGFAHGVAIGPDGRIFVAGAVRTDSTNFAGVQCLTEYGYPCRDYPFEYSAKVICGIQPDPLTGPVARGFYSTTVNIHNPATAPTELFKKLALTRPPEAQAPGDVLPISVDSLEYDEALATDCPDLWRRFFPDAPGTFLEGFVVVQSTASLDVTGVYSTALLDEDDRPGAQASIDVEDVRERLPGPQLSVTKTAEVVPWEIFDNYWWHGILYTVAVTNSGNALLPDVTLVDEQVLEQNASVVGLAALFSELAFLPPGVSVIGTPSFTPPTASISFDLGSLAPGETKQIQFGALALHYVIGHDPESLLSDRVTVLSGGVAADVDASAALATFLFGP